MESKSITYFLQDFQWCSPIASACYTTVAKDFLGLDCGVSCTGLYTDVAFTEDKILNLKTDLVTTSTSRWKEKRLKVEQASNGKERQRLLSLLQKYTDYKENFNKQIKFNSSLASLSEYV